MQAAEGKLSPFVATSVVLHVLLFMLVVFVPSLFPATTVVPWGSSTDRGIRVGVVSSLPGIPLPSPPVVQETATPNNSKTLNPAETAPKAQEKVPATPADIKIPSATKKAEKKKEPEKKSETAPLVASRDQTPPVVSNAIPGGGGQIPLPYGQAGGGQATFSGDATFGTRFPEYVVSMTRAITNVWQQFSVAGVGRGASPRVYVTFTIDKRGRVSNLEIAQPSGVAQLDNSAKQTMLTVQLPPLPPAYSGSSVDVRFYFEYTR